MAFGYAEARHELAEQLSRASLGHSERVAETAAWIAGAYGADVDAARLAGLLHDWDRDTPRVELLERAEALGLPVTEADRAVPYLLHGPVAARNLAARHPELEADVVAAVAEHTVGSPLMGPLSMIVYIADVIEPGRDHPYLSGLRESVGRVSLSQLFADAYAASLARIVDRRRPIHPVTLAVWNALVARERR